MKLKEIVDQLEARLEPRANGSEITGESEITGIAPIESAAPGEITFVSNPKYAPLARTTRASAIIVEENFPRLDGPEARALVRAKDPQYAYARVVEMFHQPVRYDRGIHPTAVIHPSARIGANASVGACVVIDAEVEIGENCTLMPHVVIYRGVTIGKNFFAHAHVSIREHCRIGDNVLLHNGVVIGSDGFGFARGEQGRWQKILQAGKVVLEDDVEVQANSCIDRASLGETRIGRFTKIDNLVQVGHNCAIGENGLLCAQAGLAGSTELGKNVILAGQVGVAGHCKLGDGVVVTAQSGTHGDIEPGAMMSGSPAIEHKRWMRSITLFHKLPELARAMRLAARPPKKD